MTADRALDPMVDGPVGLAVVGAGRMGRLFGDVARSLAWVHVAWVVSRTADHAEALAAALGARATCRLEDALADPSVDAVVIATPAPSHAALTQAAARAGKAVFVEKPLATALDEGRALVEAVERSGVPVQVGFQRRFDPAYAEAHARLRAGELGDPEAFRAVGRDAAPPPIDYLRTSGGLFVDLGIHDLDLARYLVGEVAEVRASGTSFVPELAAEGLIDTAVALLHFENGALGTVELGLRSAHGYEVRTEVVGSRGRVTVERERDPDLTRFDAAGTHVTSPAGFDVRFRQAFVEELRSFAGNVARGRPVAPTPRDAWHSLRLALAAQHALERGGAVDVQAFGGRL